MGARIARVGIRAFDLPLARPLRVGGRTLERRGGLLVIVEDGEGHAGDRRDGAPAGLHGESTRGGRRAAARAGGAARRRAGPRRVPRPRRRLRGLARRPGPLPSVRDRRRGRRADAARRPRRGRTCRTCSRPSPAARVRINGLLDGDAGGGARRRRASRRTPGTPRSRSRSAGATRGDEARLVRSGARAASGRTVALRLDANRAWDLATALDFAARVAPAGIEYLEEPLRDRGRPRGLRRGLAGPGRARRDAARASPRRRRRRCAVSPRSSSRPRSSAATSARWPGRAWRGASGSPPWSARPSPRRSAWRSMPRSPRRSGTNRPRARHLRRLRRRPRARAACRSTGGRIDARRLPFRPGGFRPGEDPCPALSARRPTRFPARDPGGPHAGRPGAGLPRRSSPAPPCPGAARDRRRSPRRCHRWRAAATGPLHREFRELDRITAAAARGLRARGIPPGERVALLLPPGPAYPVLLLALLRAGAVAVPLSTRLPEAALPGLLERIGCRRLITDDRRPRDAAAGIETIDAAELLPSAGLRPQPARTARAAALPPFDPAADATIVFTSGSTGAPKAALHSFENHWASAAGSNRNIPLRPGDRWLLSLPLWHVGGLAVVFRCLLGGAAVAVAGQDEPLADAIAALGATHVSLVATQLYRLLREERGRAALRGLKAVLLGGGPAPAALIEEALARRGAPRHELRLDGDVLAGDRDAPRRPAGGAAHRRPAARLPRDSPSPPTARSSCGAAPSSAATSREPAGPPGARRRRVVPHRGPRAPRRRRPPRRPGRRDTMFISGGENIHPEEIEREILRFPGVLEAIVVPVPDPEFGARPVAFLRTADGAPAGRAGTRALAPRRRCRASRCRGAPAVAGRRGGDEARPARARRAGARPVSPLGRRRQVRRERGAHLLRQRAGRPGRRGHRRVHRHARFRPPCRPRAADGTPS